MSTELAITVVFFSLLVLIICLGLVVHLWVSEIRDSREEDRAAAARNVQQLAEALKFLSALADTGANLLAMTAIPMGLHQTQLTIFPDDSAQLEKETARVGVKLQGPHPAFLVRGRDVPGALVEIHEKLYRAGINVYASTGVSSGEGRYGYILYVKPEDFSDAADALEL